MHLIRHCSVSGNKCGRLSDLVPSRHVSMGALLCQPVCLWLSSPPPLRPVFLSSLLLRSVDASPTTSSPLSPALLTQASSSSTVILISFLLTILIIPLSSQQITTLSGFFLSLLPNCLSSSSLLLFFIQPVYSLSLSLSLSFVASLCLRPTSLLVFSAVVWLAHVSGLGLALLVWKRRPRCSCWPLTT